MYTHTLLFCILVSSPSLTLLLTDVKFMNYSSTFVIAMCCYANPNHETPFPPLRLHVAFPRCLLSWRRIWRRVRLRCRVFSEPRSTSSSVFKPTSPRQSPPSAKPARSSPPTSSSLVSRENLGSRCQQSCVSVDGEYSASVDGCDSGRQFCHSCLLMSFIDFSTVSHPSFSITPMGSRILHEKSVIHISSLSFS